jgi:hypothetical protein
MPAEPKQKLAMLRDAWSVGDTIGALRIASRFSDRSDDTIAFKRAWDAHTNPSFYRQIGRDPAAVTAAGVDAMARKFKLPR